jgi:hypothetical protein
VGSRLWHTHLELGTMSIPESEPYQHIQTPEFTNDSKSSAALVACNHVAILTRGIEDSDDRPIVPRRQVVAVSGRLASNPSFIVSMDAEDDVPVPALSTAIVTEIQPLKIDPNSRSIPSHPVQRAWKTSVRP